MLHEMRAFINELRECSIDQIPDVREKFVQAAKGAIKFVTNDLHFELAREAKREFFELYSTRLLTVGEDLANSLATCPLEQLPEKKAEFEKIIIDVTDVIDPEHSKAVRTAQNNFDMKWAARLISEGL